DRNRSHWSTSKTPSYTKSVSWQHHPIAFVTAQEKIILQIQCRISDEERRGQLIHALAARIQSEFGVTAAIDLLPPHSIPRTSSGKPARAEAKKRYQKAYAASLHVQESLA
ncbi:hypothetical protein OU569_17400, partial [Escherichia coli]|nr:hypothetical protein [Escherichia coli]MDF8760608.1 hypothetical protein [Escherichia coli]MDF8789402.1 hypothetical protein [Escherichia coli]